MAEQPTLFDDPQADLESNFAYAIRMLRLVLESRFDQAEGLYVRCNTSDLTRVLRALDEFEAREQRAAEMIRIKDDLINRQVRRIMHLDSVRG